MRHYAVIYVHGEIVGRIAASLAGSTAYAIGEGRKRPVVLARKPKEAVAFYVVLSLSAALAVAVHFMPIDPISPFTGAPSLTACWRPLGAVAQGTSANVTSGASGQFGGGSGGA